MQSCEIIFGRMAAVHKRVFNILEGSILKFFPAHISSFLPNFMPSVQECMSDPKIIILNANFVIYFAI